MNRLKKWRYENNVTLMEFAKKIGVSYPIAWKFEGDKKLSEKMNYYINHKLDELEKEEK
jgi:transcriptional regulator with XRE-family HTH domain